MVLVHQFSFGLLGSGACFGAMYEWLFLSLDVFALIMGFVFWVLWACLSIYTCTQMDE